MVILMKKRYVILIFLFIGIYSCTSLDDKSKSSSSQRHWDSDSKRGVLLFKKFCQVESADGYKDVLEDKTIFEARHEAILEAQKNIIRKVQIYLKNEKGIKSFDKSPQFTILEQKDYNIEKKQYHVWIKAQVTYDIPYNLLDQSDSLKVEVQTSQKKYRRGDNILIYIKGNQDYYAYIFNQKANGENFQLFPNNLAKNNFFEGEKLYTIPQEKNNFEFKASPPFGKDKIIVYASKIPLTKLPEIKELKRGIEIVSIEKTPPDTEIYKVEYDFITEE